MDKRSAHATSGQDKMNSGKCSYWRIKAGLGLLLLSFSSAAFGQNVPGRTIGLVLTDIRYSLYQTPGGKEECPDGLQASEEEQFKATPGYKEHLDRFGGTAQNRAPNGATANYSPMEVEDPLPWKELKTKTGYGFNLDGTANGKATAKTCAHTKFLSPEGLHVDNQMARVLGCVQGWRTSGSTASRYSKDVESSIDNRILIEITGVDDEKNDPNVEVAIYKSRDRLVRSPTGFVPFMSHRVDELFPQYMSKTHGKIVDGVLTTDPIPLARMPMMIIRAIGERQVRDLTLRLKLDPEGATGLMGGYEPLDSWWDMLAKSPYSGLSHYSPALLYKEAHRFADGYPDPVTKQCTAISVAYDISATRALIVHGNGGRQQTAAVQN